MPNQTIDLSRDCEAWYDFDTDYFDAQRGVIQDRSGHGRHAEASGGPTVGVEGPDSFEAASFDGSDDKFRLNLSPNGEDNPNGQTEFSITFIFKANSDGPIFDFNDFRVQSRFNNGFFQSYVRDDDNVLEKVNGDVDIGEFAAATMQWDNGVLRLFINGELNGAKDSFTSDSIRDGNNEALTIGSQQSSNYINADIAYFGYWSRLLNSTEIKQIARLTAPRRSQL